MPDALAASRMGSFLKTVGDEKDQLRKVFEQYSAAKIICDGLIVPNLVLNFASEMRDAYQRFGNEADYNRRMLAFMTTSSMLYTVDFDKFYLKADETVFVD